MAAVAGRQQKGCKLSADIPHVLVVGIAVISFMTCLWAHPVTASHHSHGPKTLDFYMRVAVQNNTDLNNPANYTAVQSGQPPKVEPNSFGVIHTFDNPITTQPDLNSTHLGRVQGYYGDVGQSVLTLFLVQTFTYNDGKYNGTFSLVGVDVVTDLHKLAAIVGGTGDFAFVRGVAEQRLVSTQDIDNETVSWFQYSITFKY